MSVTVSGIDALNTSLRQYILLSKKTAWQALDKHANALRIALFQRYWSVRWAAKLGFKMPSPGRGVIVRSKTMIGDYSDSAPTKTTGGHKVNWYQKLVWQEIARRQKGIGLLGISFLFRRWNPDKTRLIENKSRLIGTLARVESRYQINNESQLEASATITGTAPGMKKVSDRYGIEAGAIKDTTENINVYVRRKLAEAAMQAGLKGFQA